MSWSIPSNLNDILDSEIASITNFQIFPDGRVSFDDVSTGCEAVFGYSKEEIAADKNQWRSRIQADDFVTIIVPAQAQALASGSSSIKYRFLHKDGTWHWIQSNLYAHSIDSVLLISQDVTQQKQTEAALAQFKAQYRFLFENQPNLITNDRLQYLLTHTPAVVFSCKPSGDYRATFISENVRTILGYEPQQFLEDSSFWINRIHPDDVERIIAESINIFENGTHSHEYRFFHANGDYRWIFSTAKLIRDKANNPCEIIGYLIDISDRKRNEDERNQAEELAQQQAEREQLLRGVTQRIRQSLDLDQILSTTVLEVQQTLQADRALILRLQPDGSGEVIEETVLPGYPELCQMRWADVCFSANCYEYYRQGNPRIVLNAAEDEWGSCIANFMQEIGVQSKVVAPIVQTPEASSPKVWGLLIVHACSSFRHWQQSEADLLQQISNQLAIAIQQSQLYQQTRQQAQREQALNRVVQAIRSSLDLGTIFSTAVAEVGALLDVHNVSIVQYLPRQRVWVVVAGYSKDAISTIGQKIPDEGNPLADRLKRFEVVEICDTDTLEDEVNRPLAQKFPGSWLLMPLRFDSSLWGNLNMLRRTPGPWQPFEVELAQTIADQLAIATHQASLYHQLQTELIERRQTEETLRRSEARFRKIFADAPIGMMLLTSDGQIVQINRTLYQMLDYSEVELKAQLVQTVLHPADVRQQQLLTQKLFNREIPHYTLKKRFFKRNGDVVWVRMTAALLRDPTSRILYKFGMVENITERRAVEQMKDNFVSIVSHELRTPITSVRGSLGLLATGQLGTLTSEGQELLNIAVSESQRLARLVDDILDLERIQSGHITLVKEPYWVTDLIARSIEVVRPLANEAMITIEVSAARELLMVDGDRIIQTLTNLLNNAIKFSPNNSTIWITAERITAKPIENGRPSIIPPAVMIQVKDQGRGIPPDKLNLVFQPFEQVEVADSRQKGGSGLGLAICQSIIKQHGGQIWVTSTLDQGSTFSFTLPLTALESIS